MAYNEIEKCWEGYIYRIVNNVNGKTYVGQTRRTPEQRWAQHTSAKNISDGESGIAQALKKYGVDNFSFEVLDQISRNTKEELIDALNELEIQRIKENDSYGVNGYNHTHGGDSALEQYIERIVVDVYGLDTSYICSYDSMFEAAEAFGCTVSSVSLCCNGKTPNVNGFVFRKHGDSYNLYDTRSKHVGKDIYQFTFEGDFVAHYDNSWKAARITGMNLESIAQVVDKPNRSLYGYIWSSKPEFPGCSKKIRKINMYTSDGVYVKTYDRVCDAQDDGFDRHGVSGCCLKRQRIHRGHMFYYIDDESQPDKTKIVKRQSKDAA